MSHDKCWYDVVKERRSTTAYFKSVHQLQFTKHSCLRPSRMLRHSLQGFGTLSSIHVELECLKIWLAQCNFHNLPPFLTLYMGPTCGIGSQAPPLSFCIKIKPLIFR